MNDSITSLLANHEAHIERYDEQGNLYCETCGQITNTRTNEAQTHAGQTENPEVEK